MTTTVAEVPDGVPDGPGIDNEGPVTLDTRAVLEEMRGSVALIVTPLGSGSSVLIDDGYLVTNAHVVDPYSHVDVLFEDAAPIEDVPVVGVDLVRDIAVVGPVSIDRPAKEIVSAGSIEQGSDLYLVGFPGQQNDLQATISRGVLSRRTAIGDWDLELLQSDATIGAGQSGGALVDERGRVVGISGMRDSNSFALSLSGSDVMFAVDRILDGDGTRWLSVPPQGQVTSRDVLVQHPGGLEVFHVPAGDRAREIRVSVDDPEVAVGLVDAEGWVSGGNRHLLDWAEEELLVMFRGTGFTLSDSYGADEVERGEDGSLTFTVEPGWDQFIVTGSLTYGASYSVEMSESVTHLDRRFAPGQVSVGGSRQGAISAIMPVDRVLLDLDEGQSVEIVARSPFGDMAFMLMTPEALAGGDEEDGRFYSESGAGGAFGGDDLLEYTATTSGSHAIDIYTRDGEATEYRVEVR